MEDFCKFVGFIICMGLVFLLVESFYSKPSNYDLIIINESEIETGKTVYYDDDNGIEFSCNLTPKGIKQVQLRQVYELSLK